MKNKNALNTRRTLRWKIGWPSWIILPITLLFLITLGCISMAVATQGDREAPLETEHPETPTETQTVQKWKLWPDEKRVFQPLLADPREAVFRGGALWIDAEDLFEDFNFGIDLGIYRYQWAPEEALSLTARGVFTARFDFGSESFDLMNTDFIGGVAVGYRKNSDSVELYIYHQSSHAGDELVEREAVERIDYAREAVRLLYARQWTELRLYGGITYNFHALPEALENRFTLQAGAEYRFAVMGQPMFLAGDFQSRQENDWNLNSALQVGVELGNPRLTANRQYIFMELFQGKSNMGQFWNRNEKYIYLGLGYQFR